MPLPLGHTAIGLATFELAANRSAFRNWYRLAVIVVLANLPDIDVIFGLFLRSDGKAFHRGPTHSLLFALVMAVLIWGVNRRWIKIPDLSFLFSFLLILSHVCADALLTASPVSFFWPFEIHFSTGHASLVDVIHSVLFDSIRDGWIILICGLLLVFRRMAGKSRLDGRMLFKRPVPVPGFLRIKKDPRGRG